jgi:hypothetical protein
LTPGNAVVVLLLGTLFRIKVYKAQKRSISKNYAEKVEDRCARRITSYRYRGIERCLIFQDDADYGNFLDRFGVAAEASRRLKLSIAGVSLPVKRGEIIARDRGYSLVG